MLMPGYKTARQPGMQFDTLLWDTQADGLNPRGEMLIYVHLGFLFCREPNLAPYIGSWMGENELF